MLDHTDLLATVREDLIFISETFHHSMDEGSLRRASTCIRRLIVDGDLQRAWKAAGFEREPRLLAVDLDLYLTGVDRSLVVSASAGGTASNGGPIGPSMVGRFASSEEQLSASFARGICAREFTLSEFCKSPSLVTEGCTVSRRQVVKYLANKIGGAHHDAKRGITDDDLSFAALDHITKGRPIQIADKTPVHFELLAVGQALASSDDLRRFTESIQGGRGRR